MIRLVTVIGHQAGFLSQFIGHYINQVDEINIVIYKSPASPGIEEKIKEVVSNSQKVKIVKTIYHRVFDWDKVTELYNEIKSTHPDDWWVIADIDEFHLYPYNDLRDMIKQCDAHGWELVRGGFIDRIGYGGDFNSYRSDVSIWQIYPMAGFFRYPMSKACPNKVCVMKGYIPITSGQHYAKIDGHTTWRWQGWNHPLIAPVDKYSVQVHHFKWDKSVLERLLAVANVNQEYSFSDEYRKMYNEIQKNNYRIDVNNPEYMFEECGKADFNYYKQWNKLIKKIIAI